MEFLDNDGGFYQPSVDDVGTRICLRVQGLGENSSITKITATSVLSLDPEVDRICAEKLKNDDMRFEVRERENVKSCLLILRRDRIEFKNDDNVDDDDDVSSVKKTIRLGSSVNITASPSNAHHFQINGMSLGGD